MKKGLLFFLLLLPNFMAFQLFGQAFVTTWVTDDGTIIIPTNSSDFTYNYNVTWTNLSNVGVGNGSTSGQIDNYTITGLTNGDTYQLEITGTFPAIYINGGDAIEKIKTIEQWGNIAWQSMENAFRWCTTMQYNATDVPDLSNVTNTAGMFYACRAMNGNLNSWNVSTVENMSGMFTQAFIFNTSLSNWNVCNVRDMSSMFSAAKIFNGSITSWNISKVENMNNMFQGADAFNQNISIWNVSSVKNMSRMFYSADLFNISLNAWNVSQVEDMSSMFAFSNYNQNITSWNVSSVKKMNNMFWSNTAFNQAIGSWNVSSVTDMRTMFDGANKFNQDLSNWNVSAVTNMGTMFRGASTFNGDISTWNTSNVTNMGEMFRWAYAFQGDLSNWDVSRVKNMFAMFQDVSGFNSDISNWAVDSLPRMEFIFSGASSFDQNLGNWNISGITNMRHMFTNSGMSIANYDNTLIGWAAQAVEADVTLDATGLQYCNASAAVVTLTGAPNNWVINDAGQNCAVTTWNGTTWSNGAPLGAKSAIINGNYSTLTNGEIFCLDLTINSEDTLTVNSDTKVEVAGDLHNLGAIIVNEKGVFVQSKQQPSNSGNGTYTVQRLAPNSFDQFNFWSSPVVGLNLGDPLNVDATNMYTYEATTQQWIKATASTPMVAGAGYIATGRKPMADNATIMRSFSGTNGFHTGTISRSVSFSNDLDDTNDWNLLGNPYPSGMSVGKFLATNYDAGNGAITNAIYIWNSDGNDTGGQSSDYAIMNPLGVANAGGNTAPTSTTISACQGFFVQAVANGTISFENVHRNTKNNTFLRTQEETIEQRLWIKASINGYENEVLLGLLPNASIGKDQYDAQKLSLHEHLKLYTKLNGSEEEWAIQALPSLAAGEEKTVGLGLNITESGEVVFSLNHIEELIEGNEGNGHGIFLYDAQTEQWTDLRNARYTLELEAGEYPNRFFLKWIDYRITSIEEESFAPKPLIYAANHEIYLQFNALSFTNGWIQIHDLMGRTTLSKQLTSTADTSIPFTHTGVYIVELQLDQQVITQKIIVY